MRFLVPLILIGPLIAGCGLRDRFDSAENRINSAKPPDSGVQAARQLLLAQTADQPTVQKMLEPMWASRLRLRALNCSRDYTPTWRDSSAVISSRLSDTSCFADADRALQRWLGFQRVRLLLAQGSIRPPPQSLPGIISHHESISMMVPAREAPVAILRGPSGFDVVELGSGKSIFRESVSQNSSGEMSLAPNGRLFAQASPDKVLIRATEGGETLVELPNANGVLWLDSTVLAVRTRNNASVRVLDLATGDESAMPGVNDGWGTIAVRAPGAPNRFNLLLSRGAIQIEIVEVGGHREAQLRAEQHTTSGHGFSPYTDGASADGSIWIDAHQGMRVLNLDTLELQEPSFKPMQTQWACPTPNPEEFVLSIPLSNGDGVTSSFRHFLYAHRGGTLAPISNDTKSSARYHYVRSIKRLALIDNKVVRFIETLPAGEPQPATTILAALTDELNQRRLAMAATQPSAAPGLPTAPGAAIAPQSNGEATPLQAQLREAQVEGVGVYEGAGAKHGGGQSRLAGVVEVRVRRSSRPIALVLSSYEPVRWMIITEPGAKLSAVMLSGYHDSTVIGAGVARVYQIGQGYAYGQQSPGYAELQRTVARWAGKPIAVFQGRYQGSNLSVGGGY